MSKKDDFKGYLIPNEYLKNIKGGEEYPSGIGRTFCPSCGSKNIVITVTIPPTYGCWDCKASWFYRETPDEIIIDMRGGTKGDIVIQKK